MRQQMRKVKEERDREIDELKLKLEEQMRKVKEERDREIDELKLKLEEQMRKDKELNQQHNELRQERDHKQGQLEEARRHAEESDKKRRESLIKSEQQMRIAKEETDDLHREIDEHKLKPEQQRHDLNLPWWSVLVVIVCVMVFILLSRLIDVFAQYSSR